jgi:hypothetical protein
MKMVFVRRLGLLSTIALLGLSVVFPNLMTGCAAADALQRRDLEDGVFKHHLELRWSRTAKAAAFVHPDLQNEFVESWTERASMLEISTLDVVNIQAMQDEETGEKTAQVTVLVTWVQRDTMSVRESVVDERWVHADGKWVVEKPLLPEDIIARGKAPSAATMR